MIKRKYQVHCVIEGEYNFYNFDTPKERKAFKDGVSITMSRMEEEHGGTIDTNFTPIMKNTLQEVEKELGHPVVELM